MLPLVKAAMRPATRTPSATRHRFRFRVCPELPVAVARYCPSGEKARSLALLSRAERVRASPPLAAFQILTSLLLVLPEANICPFGEKVTDALVENPLPDCCDQMTNDPV